MKGKEDQFGTPKKNSQNRTMWNKDGSGILKQKSRRKRIREEEQKE